MIMQKPYLMISATVFLLVALAHLVRLISGLPVQIAGFEVPLWLSVPGVVFPAALAFWGVILAMSVE